MHDCEVLEQSGPVALMIMDTAHTETCGQDEVCRVAVQFARLGRSARSRRERRWAAGGALVRSSLYFLCKSNKSVSIVYSRMAMRTDGTSRLCRNVQRGTEVDLTFVADSCFVSFR